MITSRFLRCLASLLLVLAVTPVRADPNAPAFCAWAQQVIAQTDLTAEVVMHKTREDFVQSKATTSPFVVHQYFSNPVSTDNGMPRVVSCKMKTAERINQAQLNTAAKNPVAAGDQSCDAVHRQMLESVVDGIATGHRAPAAGRLVVDEEEMTFMGPMWLKPWPFQPLSRDGAGRLHLHSRALYVPFAWWIPMPDRFKGAYYCHLVAPDFLEAIVRGEVPPGV